MIHFSAPTVLCAGAPQIGPHHNAALPSLLVCADRSLLLAHRVGTHKNSADGTQWLWRSRDEGATWSRLPFPFALTPQGAPGEFRTAALSEVGGGQIAMLLTWIDHPDAETPLANPQTEGLLPIHMGWTASADHGQTWSPLREIPVTPFVQPCGNGPLLLLADGRWMATFEIYKAFDDPSPWSARSAVTFSRDQGESWSVPTVIAADSAHIRSYWDQHVHLRPDASFLGLMWMDDRGNAGRSDILWVESRDSGSSWTTPQTTGLAGQYSTLLVLPDGRLLLFYVVRDAESAIRIAVSVDHGRSWQPQADGLLYQQGANDLLAVRREDFAAYLQSMGRWTFGWPSAVRLPSGEILVAYYAGAGNLSSVFLRRLRLS